MKTENEVKHTPGPWIVMGNQRNGHYDFVLPMAEDKDFHANARLIASAPELLEALKNCINALYGGYSPHDAIEQAKQVIAKAEGN